MAPRSKQCQNSAEQCHTPGTPTSPLQRADELHQKDLRIFPDFVHISGPGNQWYLRADTFRALSLIVEFNVPRDPKTARRVDIQYLRPCQITYLSQFIEY